MYGSHASNGELLDGDDELNTFGKAVRVSRRWLLGVVLLTVAAHGLADSVHLYPGCANDFTTCARTALNTSITPCSTAPAVLGAFLPFPQIGFVSNAPVSDVCLAAGCGANQCLRTSVKCSGSGFPVFSCESAESTVDMQPLPTFFHTGLAIVSLVILFARRPVDLSNARIAGILLIVWAGYNIASNVRVYQGCDWSEQSTCSHQSSLVSSVTLTQCSALGDLSPFSSNGPVTDAGCMALGCSAGQCLRTSRSCSSGVASSSCVSGVGTSDADPGVLVTQCFILVAGLLVIRRNDPLGWRRVIGLSLFVWGMTNLGGSVRFVRACDMTGDSGTVCGNNQEGNLLSVIPCFEQTASVPWSPFAINMPPNPSCVAASCSADECLHVVTTCPGGVQVTGCLPTTAAGAAMPVAVVFNTVVLAVALMMLCNWHQARVEDDAHCMHCF